MIPRGIGDSRPAAAGRQLAAAGAWGRSRQRPHRHVTVVEPAAVDVLPAQRRALLVGSSLGGRHQLSRGQSHARR